VNFTQAEAVRFNIRLVFSEIAFGTLYAHELDAMKSPYKLSRPGSLEVVVFLSSIALLLLPITSASLTVTNIASGSVAADTLFVKSDGSLWAMGWNFDGQLGDGTYSTNYPFGTNRPEQIVSSGVTAIAAGGDHSLFLKSDGSLWVMGSSYNGQLGNGTFNSTNRPEQIVASDVVAIAAGGDHSLFLKTDGSLWGMGRNDSGQLGDGAYPTSFPFGTNQPEQIVASGITAIAAGVDYSLFLKSDGSLWAMGYNGYGELGDGTYGNPAFNYCTNRPEQIVASGVTAIAAGYAHSLFLKSDGSLWAMGWNTSGQLGDGTLNSTNRPEQIVASGVTAIAAGYYYSLFVKSDGSLWVMGSSFPYNSTNGPEQIVAGGVTAIAAGIMFLKSDGSLWAIGGIGYGQLGDGFTNSSPSLPEQIFPSPQPVLNSSTSSQTNLQFNATCGFGGNFCLLGSTTFALPLNQWTPLATNAVTARGTNNYSVTLTNAFNPGGPQFYILKSP
jgi:alpha-tubulin suppressor-like RCC1 family protein